MNRAGKRIVLLSIAAVAALALYGAVGKGNGLPAANPAAAKAAPAPASAPPDQQQPSPEQIQAAERIQELQQRLAENPRDALALAEMVDGLFSARRYAQAAELLNQALEAGQDNSRLRSGLGMALFYQGMPSLAQRELRRAIELDANNIQAHFNYALTMSHGSKSDLEAAQASWRAVVRLDPDGELGQRARTFLTQ